MEPRSERFRFRRGALRWVMLAALSLGATRVVSAAPSVFDGPEARYELAPPDLASGLATAPPGLVRWVLVEERVGEARLGAAVRTPVFFADGECRDLADFRLVRWPGGEVVPWQADDVRRGPDGGVARAHLWFTTDLARGETQRFALVRGGSAAPSTPAVSVELTADEIAVSAGGTSVAFKQVGATPEYALTKISALDGPTLEFPEGLHPRVESSLGEKPTSSAPDAVPVASAASSWGTGPVFAKVVSERTVGGAVRAAQVWRIFSDGHVSLSQTLIATGGFDGVTIKSQDFGRGRWRGDPGITVEAESASLIDTLQDVHRGYQVDALVEPGKRRAWLSVPGSLGGTAGRLKVEAGGDFRWRAQGNLTPGTGDARPGSVYALWSEVSLVPAAWDGAHLMRATVRAAGQPLVAVVERPGMTVAKVEARIADNVREMKPVGWANEAIVKFLQGKAAPFAPRKLTREADPEYWLAEAHKAELKVKGGRDRPLAEPEKGRAAGALDPYHVTYETTGVLPWVRDANLPAPLRDSLRARLTAVQRHLGRVDDSGWPYLDVFARTQNMQMGPPLLALADGGGDPAMRQFYRDQLAAPTVAAVMLRGLRPYQGRPQTGPDESDALYQSVVDFLLRATELSLNQSLGFQPVALGRYLDAIDVNADLYHPARTRRREGEPDDFPRANFFRLQSHLHRWLGWGPAPFVSLLRPGEHDPAVTIGATEAWHRADALVGTWKNWPDQSWLYLASVLPSVAQSFLPVARPAEIPLESHVEEPDGIRLRWKIPAGVDSCRVYRLRPGAAPVWLNSPYREAKPSADAGSEWLDREGRAGDRYRVHGVDGAGNETAW